MEQGKDLKLEKKRKLAIFCFEYIEVAEIYQR